MRRTAVVLDAATTSTLAQRFRRWAVAGRVFGFDLEQLSLAQSPEGGGTSLVRALVQHSCRPHWKARKETGLLAPKDNTLGTRTSEFLMQRPAASSNEYLEIGAVSYAHRAKTTSRHQACRKFANFRLKSFKKGHGSKPTSKGPATSDACDVH